MTHRYVYSGAAGAADGTSWTDAYTTLAAALTADAAGDNIWVADDHAETQASAMSLTSSGTSASPVTIICARRVGGSVPPVLADWRTTATVSTTGANAMTITGSFWCYGHTFNSANSGTNITMLVANTAGNAQHFVACKLKNGSATNPKIACGPASGGALTILENTTVEFGGASGGLEVGGVLEWLNTPSAVPGTAPTTLFTHVFRSTAGCDVRVRGVDLSAVSGTLVVAGSLGDRYLFEGCDLHASVTIAGTPTAPAGPEINVVRCDAANNRRHERWTYAGSQTLETTIVRTGGASDGSNAGAWKIVTTANAELLFPFVSYPLTVWNETVGSAINLTVHGIWGGGAVPNNNDIWIEADYYGTSGSPVLSRASGRVADPFASPAGLTADSGETWGGSTTKFKQTLSFTPQQKGPITVWVKAAAVSATFYIDPVAILS